MEKQKREVLCRAFENNYTITTGGKVYWILGFDGKTDVLIGDANEQFTVYTEFLGRTFWILSKRKGLWNWISGLFQKPDLLKLKLQFANPEYFTTESWKRCRDYSSVESITLPWGTVKFTEDLDLMPMSKLTVKSAEDVC